MFHNIIQIIKKCHYEEPKGFGDEVIQIIFSLADDIIKCNFFKTLTKRLDCHAVQAIELLAMTELWQNARENVS